MRPTLMHVLEETEPEGAKRLECFRLTTLGVESRRDTTRVLDRFRLKWRIEDRHRVLKAGCKMECPGHRRGSGLGGR